MRVLRIETAKCLVDKILLKESKRGGFMILDRKWRIGTVLVFCISKICNLDGASTVVDHYITLSSVSRFEKD